jgi:hypothetical protein
MFMWLRDYIRDNGHFNKANSCHVFHNIIRFLWPQKARVIRLSSKGKDEFDFTYDFFFLEKLTII